MKLIDNGTAEEVSLSDDFLWDDELKWLPAVSKPTYTLTGALLIETSVKQAGRPLTLKAEKEMAWVSRGVVERLRALASDPTKTFTLVLEYPTDTRQFKVVFRHNDTPVEADPVKGFPGHDTLDWFNITLRLMEVL